MALPSSHTHTSHTNACILCDHARSSGEDTSCQVRRGFRQRWWAGAAQVLVIIESRQLALVQMNQTIDYSFIDTPVSQLRANMSQVAPRPSPGCSAPSLPCLYVWLYRPRLHPHSFAH